MDHIVLPDTFVIGHAVLDAEHQDLVARLNGAIDLVNEGAAFDVLQAQVKTLLDALRTHIAHEEEIMANLAYAVAVEEKKSHVTGLQEFSDLLAQHADGHDPEAYILSLGNVLLTTFLKTDMGLKAYLPELLHKKF